MSSKIIQASLNATAQRKSECKFTKPQGAQWKTKNPRQPKLAGVFKMFPAITYFRTGGHYHRPQKLNGRVRNGNVCGLLGMVTGIRQGAGKAAHPDGVYNRCDSNDKLLGKRSLDRYSFRET